MIPCRILLTFNYQWIYGLFLIPSLSVSPASRFVNVEAECVLRCQKFAYS
jgi:hypothetical protein